MNKLPFHLIIIGPQGSGKGTQGRFLSLKFKMPYFSAGELIRKKAQEESVEGKKIKNLHDKGFLIPHKLTKKLFVEALKKIPSDQPVIFEGYPRAEEQYWDFLDILKKRKVKDFRAILLKIKDETVYRRLSGRRYCTSCEQPFYPPASFELKECPLCHGKLARRADDTKEAISKRLRTYKKETKKVIEILKKNKKLIEIDGEPKIEEVSEAIVQKLKNEANKNL